jgi:hypothetical protein
MNFINNNLFSYFILTFLFCSCKTPGQVQHNNIAGPYLKFDASALCDTVTKDTTNEHGAMSYCKVFNFRFTNIGTETLIFNEMTFKNTGDQYFFTKPVRNPVLPGQSDTLKIILTRPVFSTRDFPIRIYSNSVVQHDLNIRIVME